ncbi:MAG: hypothetical protein ACRC3B_11770, partial [Bacteroidia bacterium]
MVINFFNFRSDLKLTLYPTGNNSNQGLAIFWVIIYSGMALYADYMVFRGTRKEAEMLDSHEMMVYTKKLWRTYLIIMTFTLIIAVLTLMTKQKAWAVPAFIGLIVIIILQVSVWYRLFKYSKLFLPPAFIKFNNHSIEDESHLRHAT